LNYTACTNAGADPDYNSLGTDWVCSSSTKYYEDYVSTHTVITGTGSGMTEESRGCRFFVICQREGYEDKNIYSKNETGTNHKFTVQKCERPSSSGQ
jgi:hypothetical protein